MTLPMFSVMLKPTNYHLTDYNLKINIEEVSSPPLGPIYSLSKTELERIFGRKYSQWIYSTYPFALRCSYTLCEEKRRCSSSLCRLSWPQQANEERPLSDPTHFRSPRQSEKCTHIHQNRPSSRLSPSLNRRRR